MREPELPANEIERLEALRAYAILDTDPERTYDDIARLAAHICGTPIALVSLVDDARQWFKARVGLDARQTPKNISFCGHVVEHSELLVVPDARKDDRFADNPLVTGPPDVVFYAGTPLRTADGFTLGSLCVIDNQPRTLTPEQLDLLAALARLVISQFDTRLVARARSEAEAETKLARRSAAKALRQRQRFFEVSNDLFCIAGFDGYFKEVNPACVKILGWSAAQLRARPFIEFVHPDDRESTIREAALLGGGEHITINFVNRYETKSGGYRSLQWSATAETADQVLLCVARDITESEARERELVDARQLAETANQAKSDFLAKMSHELRTPLNSVIGFTNLLRRNKLGKLDAKELLYLEKIGNNGIHLLSLINDLLDLSKIEAGHTELDLGPVDLAQLIAAVFDELEGVISSQHNTLRLSVPEGLAPIIADARRLKQIIINLVGNASKFTNRGQIELRVVADLEQPGHAARVDVVDNGIGIPASEVGMVFESFRQVSEGGARTHGGTGLGLAISRSLAQLHGFELDVTSVEGEGATFYLKLRPGTPTPEHNPPTFAANPAPEALAPEARRGVTPAHGGVRTVLLILLIEGDNDARLLTTKAVERLGAQVVTADTSEAGFTIAQALVPDLILLDLGLPEVHGRETVRRLSRDPRLRHVPVVIFSAGAGADIEGISAASVLERPVTIEEIAETLAEHLGPRRRALVVDDDDDTREVLCLLLHSLGVDTTQAADGHEALVSLRSVGADLILLDICMPKMTGFEFLDQLRADPELRDIPVVVCTALDLEPTEEQRVAGEAQAVIRKGFNLEGRLEEVIWTLFRKTVRPS